MADIRAARAAAEKAQQQGNWFNNAMDFVGTATGAKAFAAGAKAVGSGLKKAAHWVKANPGDALALAASIGAIGVCAATAGVGCALAAGGALLVRGANRFHKNGASRETFINTGAGVVLSTVTFGVGGVVREGFRNSPIGYRVTGLVSGAMRDGVGLSMP